MIILKFCSACMLNRKNMKKVLGEKILLKKINFVELN